MQALIMSELSNLMDILANSDVKSCTHLVRKYQVIDHWKSGPSDLELCVSMPSLLFFWSQRNHYSYLQVCPLFDLTL